MIRQVLVGLVLILTVSSCSRGIDKEKFEPLYRAGKGIEGALSVGVNYLKFGELLQALATEVSIARDKASNSVERDLVLVYGQALSGCQDSLMLWKLKNSGSQTLSIRDDAELKRIAGAYPIQGSGSGSGFMFEPESAMRVVWRDVGAKLNAASRVYNGEESSDSLPMPRS